jgi:hypothetical protein
MGVDCTLLVPTAWQALDRRYIGTQIALPRNREAWDVLWGIPTQPLPWELWEGQLRYDDEHDTYHEHAVTHDRYGKPLVMSTAAEVGRALNRFTHDSPTMRAAVAFLTEMPADFPVICFWH